MPTKMEPTGATMRHQVEGMNLESAETLIIEILGNVTQWSKTCSNSHACWCCTPQQLADQWAETIGDKEVMARGVAS